MRVPAVLAAAALCAVPFSASATPQGCVTTWVNDGGPIPGESTPIVRDTVWTNPDGSVTIQPATPVRVATGTAGYAADHTVALVQCIV